MKYFKLEEFVNSTTAKKYGIDNTPSEEVKKNIVHLVDNLLDPIRERYGAAIIVSSGYRCPALNKRVGGVATSQHLTGEAADISTGTISGNKTLFELIMKSGLDFDQLIDESHFSWVHVSLRNVNRKQVLHL